MNLGALPLAPLTLGSTMIREWLFQVQEMLSAARQP
jgi:hypothetical protein